MKTIRNLILAVALLAPVASFAAGTKDFFTYKGTAQGATNSYVIIEKQAGEPGVHYVDATVFNGDITNATALVVFYTAGADQNVKQAGISGTNAIYLNATNGWVIGDVAILSRNKDSAFERHTISAVNATSVTLTGTTGGATVAGDHLWKMTANGQVRFSERSGGVTIPSQLRLPSATMPYFIGPDAKPVLIELQGTLTNTLNTVSGKWNR